MYLGVIPKKTKIEIVPTSRNRYCRFHNTSRSNFLQSYRIAVTLLGPLNCALRCGSGIDFFPSQQGLTNLSEDLNVGQTDQGYAVGRMMGRCINYLITLFHV
jgi:hypothetical protein